MQGHRPGRGPKGNVALQLGSSFMAVSRAIPFPAPAFSLACWSTPLLVPALRFSKWSDLLGLCDSSQCSAGGRKGAPTPHHFFNQCSIQPKPHLDMCIIARLGSVSPRVGHDIGTPTAKSLQDPVRSPPLRPRTDPSLGSASDPTSCFSGHTRKMKFALLLTAP